jgi:hypothetical protein
MSSTTLSYLLKERVFDIALLVDALRRLCDGETVIDRRSSPACWPAAAGPTRSPS